MRSAFPSADWQWDKRETKKSTHKTVKQIKIETRRYLQINFFSSSSAFDAKMINAQQRNAIDRWNMRRTIDVKTFNWHNDTINGCTAHQIIARRARVDRPKKTIEVWIKTKKVNSIFTSFHFRMPLNHFSFIIMWTRRRNDAAKAKEKTKFPNEIHRTHSKCVPIWKTIGNKNN